MAERYDFYVHDNRKITFNLTEPIMREDSGVTDFVFYIPKVLNGLEVSDWQWWLVFVNAKKEKYSIALTLSEDPERPLEFNFATYTVDYAMSINAGSVQFALEAINAGTGGVINNEWHTQSYEIKIKETLQGNQAEYAETESDIISALLEEVRTKVNSLVGGATPEVKDSIAEMTDRKKIYVLSTDGNWYYYNGSAWVSGGLYGIGDPEIVVDAVNDWLNDNPEATTTVQDGSITEAKLANALKPKVLKDYVTPEMFGAKGDGVTDDTSAIQSAINTGKYVFFFSKTYAVTNTITLSGSIKINRDTVIKAVSAMSTVFSATSMGDRLRFSGGVIDCNGLANTGITLTSVNGAYIQNVKVLNAVNESINISGGNHNWVIGCKLYNNNTLSTGIVNDSPDLKIADCEIYYVTCGVNHKYGILFVSNTHIWSGGESNDSVESVGIKSSEPSNPRIFGSNLYLDSFYIALDIGTKVGVINLSESLFYWAASTTPLNCYGIRCGVNTNLSLDGCLFQSYAPIVKDDILYGLQALNYSNQTGDITSVFSTTSNVSATILTATINKGVMYIDFVLKVLELTADSTTWYPVVETSGFPPIKLRVNRLDFVAYNITKKVGLICRIGSYTTDNIIRIHVNGDLAVNNVIYGSVAIPVV